MKAGYLLCLVLSLSCILSCNHHPGKPGVVVVADEPFPQKLQSLLKPVDTTGIRHIRSVNDELRITYQETGYQPVWLKSNYVPKKSVSRLLTELEDLYWDGLDTARFHLTTLNLLK